MTKPRDPWFAECSGVMPKEKAIRVIEAYLEFLRGAPVKEMIVGLVLREMIYRRPHKTKAKERY